MAHNGTLHPAPGQKYRFATVKENYEDYSSGRVLYGAPGATGFPVRLTSEIFQRAVFALKQRGSQPPYAIYDPFCGAGYSLAVIGFLHGVMLHKIYASDINADMLATAQKNLSLLTSEGFEHRVNELAHLKDAYQKASHEEALESAKQLEKKVPNIQANIFQCDVLGHEDLPLPELSVDLVLCDLPYGKLTQWKGETGDFPVHGFLGKIFPMLKPGAVVAVSADKKQKIMHEDYEKLESMRLGKRQAVFLKKP